MYRVTSILTGEHSDSKDHKDRDGEVVVEFVDPVITLAFEETLQDAQLQNVSEKEKWLTTRSAIQIENVDFLANDEETASPFAPALSKILVDRIIILLQLLLHEK